MKLTPTSLASARLSASALLLAFGGDAWTTDLDPSLYQRLGGEPVVTKVVDQWVHAMAADPVAARTGAHDGEPASATGREAFHAIVDQLRTALDDHGVGERERNELLRLLAPMGHDAVLA